MRTSSTTRSLIVAASVAALSFGATACGSSSKSAASGPVKSSTTSAGAGSSGSLSSGSSSSGGSSSGGSSSGGSASTIGISGGNGFCSKLVNFPTMLEQDLGSVSTSPQSAVQQEVTTFKNLESSAPDELKKPLGDLVSFFETAQQASQEAASGNTSALQQLEAKEQNLGQDGEAIGQWEASHCHAS